MMKIELKNVSKRFNDTQALNCVNLDFKEEKIYGLLGRNGAGKSTILNIIANRQWASDGQVFIDGENAWENGVAQKKIYLMSEKCLYPGSMKGEKVLKWSADFYKEFDLDYAKSLADIFDLNLNKKVSSFSTGYSSIFKLIIAMSVNTPFVFFDEPVLGLDANHREIFYQKLIEKYSEKPFTAVISTHLIEEISQIIEEIIIIDSGKIIYNESCEELLQKGYTVSGPIKAVDSFVAGLNQIGSDQLGGLKTVTILGEQKYSDLPNGVEIGKLDLQKLFIKITTNKGANNEHEFNA
ncbi:ABC transporter ATP-binding protein [Eubacteriaceae bacterium ES2]|nr:ABC transporter ATP-binding protein [Eubacteriaceae bacterium ES2]